MSPRGGIQPHNRFSVQSRRSEVLFVDYMAEHLTPGGRAGIIVPEGIIFQSQTAYKQLRRMLVHGYLVAVVSLPVGLFNPYSGVKTSLLVLDQSVSKISDRIAFFKVESDGFELGAQRRPVDSNDLPQVQEDLGEFLRRVRVGEPLGDFHPFSGLVVTKDEIASDGEFNLSGERYKKIQFVGSRTWQMVEVKDVCKAILSGGTPSTKQEDFWAGDIPWITSADILDVRTAEPKRFITQEAIENTATNLIPRGNVVVVTRVGLGKLLANDFDICISQDSQGLILKDGVDATYLAYVLKRRVAEFKSVSQGSTIQGVTKRQLAQIQVPLPPLEVQQDIAAEIEGYQKVIDGARTVVENYRPHIAIDPEWPVVALGDLCSLISGQHVNRDDYNAERLGIGYLTGPSDFGQRYTNFTKWTTKPKSIAQAGDILITVKGSGLGKVNLAGADKAAIGRQLMAIRPTSAIPEYIYFHLLNMYDHIQALGGGAAIPGITRNDVMGLRIPLPTLNEQKAIVASLEREMELVNGNLSLIASFEEKIHAVINKVWGEKAAVVSVA